jgi:hypothetical protein
VTAIAALVLISIALVIISRPLLSRHTAERVRSGPTGLAELEERYRNALADIQDAQNDWEIGNLSEEDYTQFREDGRRRAAAALRDLTVYADQRAQVRSEIEREIAALSTASAAPLPTVEAPPRNGSTPRQRQLAPKAARPAQSRYVVAGAALVAVSLVGIAALYFRGVGLQQAQTPVGSISAPGATTALVDSTGAYWVAKPDGIQQSPDGRSWTYVLQGTPVTAIATRDGRPWMALGPTAALVSEDGGSTWTQAGSALPGRELGGAQSGPDAVYAYFADAGIFRTTDGSQWEQIAAPVQERVSGFAIVPGSQGGQIIYLAGSGRVIRSGDGGRTWAAASGAVNLAITGVLRGISGDPTKGAVYAATSDGIFRTTRDGTEWERLALRAPVSVVAGRGDDLVAVDDNGHVYVSDSGGVSWTGHG